MDLVQLQEQVERRGVSVTELACRTVLNRSAARRVDMDLTINPYRGCEFGCKYCYARYTHAWLDLPDPAAFETTLFAKTDAPAVLAAELARRSLVGRNVAIGTATDPYQPIERELCITRGILEAFTGCRGGTITLLTKSDLVLRDLDVLTKLHERHELTVAFTLVTLDRALQRKLEPRAPTPEKRLAAMRTLADAGLRVAASVAPVMPGVNDEEVVAVVDAAAAAGATRGWSQVLWLPSASRPVLLPWIAEQFPERAASYRRWYRDGLDPPDEVKHAIASRIRAAMTRHGWPGRYARQVWRQPSLFEDETG